MMLRAARTRPAGGGSFAEQTSAIDDASGPLGIRLVSQRERGRLEIRGGGARLIFPLEASAVEVDVRGVSHAADRTSWVLVPARTPAVVEARSQAAHTLILEISDDLVRLAAVTYEGHVREDAFATYLRAPWRLPRSNWLNEICHRYVFERAACKRRDNDATRFLETEIAKELYFACRDQAAGLPCTPVGQKESEIVRRARAHIDGHLFDADVLAGLPRACGASASSVLRAFRREVGAAPLPYVRARRLDESMILLKSSKSGVGEIATAVGYRSLPAFSEAFRARFGRRPSDVRAESHRGG